MRIKNSNVLAYLIVFIYIFFSGLQIRETTVSDLRVYYLNFFPSSILCGLLSVAFIFMIHAKSKGMLNYMIILRHEKKQDVISRVTEKSLYTSFKFLAVTNAGALSIIFLDHTERIPDWSFILYFLMSLLAQLSGWIVIMFLCLFFQVLIHNSGVSFLLTMLTVFITGFSHSRFFTFSFLVYDLFASMQVPLEYDKYTTVTSHVLTNIIIAAALYLLCGILYIRRPIYGREEPNER